MGQVTNIDWLSDLKKESIDLIVVGSAYSDVGEYIQLLYSVLKESRYMFVITNNEFLNDIWDECKKAKFIFCELIIIDKSNYALILVKRDKRRKCAYHRKNDICLIPSRCDLETSQIDKIILSNAMVNCSSKNEIVLAPFIKKEISEKIANKMSRKLIGF